jgi:hypothetical protein
MNWFRNNILQEKDIKISFVPLQTKRVMVKLAYMSKNHATEFNDVGTSDGYHCKVSLTESKSKIVLTAVFMNNVHAFPLYSETWRYPKDEIKRALKTYNRCINVVEDIKTDYEDDEMPGPTLQGMSREALRYIDIDRKDVAPSRSLEAAKYLDGETDWRSSIYGNRLPSQQGHPLTPPTINITNTGAGSINISSPIGSVVK